MMALRGSRCRRGDDGPEPAISCHFSCPRFGTRVRPKARRRRSAAAVAAASCARMTGVRENPVAGRMRGNDRVEVSPGPPQRNGASPHEHPNHAGTATTDTAEEITALALSVDNIIKVPSSEGDSSAFVELSANAAGCCFFLYPGLLALLAIQTIWRPWELQPKVHQWRKVAKGAE